MKIQMQSIYNNKITPVNISLSVDQSETSVFFPYAVSRARAHEKIIHFSIEEKQHEEIDARFHEGVFD